MGRTWFCRPEQREGPGSRVLKPPGSSRSFGRWNSPQDDISGCRPERSEGPGFKPLRTTPDPSGDGTTLRMTYGCRPEWGEGPGLVVVLSEAKDLVLSPSEPTRSFGRWNNPQDDTPFVVLSAAKDLVLGF